MIHNTTVFTVYILFLVFGFGIVYSTILVSNMKKLLHRQPQSFLFAHGFAISQAGIAARTLTLMQGSEGKDKNM